MASDRFGSRSTPDSSPASLIGIRIFITVCLAALAVGCSSGDALLYLSTPYFEAAFPQSSGEIEARLADLGIDVRHETVGVDLSVQSFISFLSKVDASFIVGTPLLADKIASAAPVFPDRRFIVLYADGLESQDNIQRLATDRSSTYTRAGAFAAAYLIDVSQQRREPVRLEVFALVDSERRRRELDTFLSGYREELSGDDRAEYVREPGLHEYQNVREARNAARHLGAVSEECALALISVGAYSLDAISAAATNGIPVIAESIGRPFSEAETVVAYINEDWIGGIIAALESRTPRVTIPTLLIEGTGTSRVDPGDAVRHLQ